MAKKDRTGNRKAREQKKQYKVPELGYYLIVTDTEATERCFFTGLRIVSRQYRGKGLYIDDKLISLTLQQEQIRI